MTGEKELYHPFDTDTVFREYRIDPAIKPAEKWSQFNVQIDGDEMPNIAETATHYFHYYDVHLLDAVRRENTIEILANCSEWEKRNDLPKHRLSPSRSVWYHVGVKGLQEKAKYYEILSLFIQALRILSLNYTGTGSDDQDSPQSKDDTVELFTKDCRIEAGNIIKKSAVTYDDLYAFLNLLCQFYIEYDNHGRTRLRDELKRDIHNLIDLLILGFDKTEEEIFAASPSPPYGGWRSTLLEWVYPNLLADAEKTAGYWLDANLDSYNKLTIGDLRLEREQLNSLLKYMQDKVLGSIPVMISEMGKEWSRSSPFFSVNMASHFRSLTVCVEDFAETLGYYCPDQEISSVFRDSLGLAGFESKIKHLLKNESWWSQYKVADKRIGEENSQDIVEKFHRIENDPLNEVRDEYKAIVRNIISTKVLRNHFNHQTVNMKQIRRKEYSRYITMVMHTMLFLWAYTLAKGWVANNSSSQ